MLCIRDIMTREVVTLAPESTIREAMELLTANHLSGAPVVSGERVVGVISMTDILGFIAELVDDAAPEGDKLVDLCTVDEAMNREVFSLQPGASVKAAATMMRQRGIHRVIVMDGKSIKGIVTALDIVRAVSDTEVAGIKIVPTCDEPSPWITN